MASIQQDRRSDTVGDLARDPVLSSKSEPINSSRCISVLDKVVIYFYISLDMQQSNRENADHETNKRHNSF